MCPDGTFAGVELLSAAGVAGAVSDFFVADDGFDAFERRITLSQFVAFLATDGLVLPYPLYGYALRCLKSAAETYRDTEECRGCGGSITGFGFDRTCEECEGCDPLPIVVWDDALDVPRARRAA
jgi:hypothetical protein